MHFINFLSKAIDLKTSNTHKEIMVNWIKTEKFINYPDALKHMEQIVS